MNRTLRLYHTGYQQLQTIDIHYGRKNADFGQGFYTSDNIAFAKRWARERKDFETIINTYELATDELKILHLERDAVWFDYIRRNRAGKPDQYPEADVIIGPIANDTLFDTFGIITSGILSADQSLSLLKIGPLYEQIVLKSETAANHLTWISSEILSSEEMERYRKTVKEEERSYQEAFARSLENAH